MVNVLKLGASPLKPIIKVRCESINLRNIIITLDHKIEQNMLPHRILSDL